MASVSPTSRPPSRFRRAVRHQIDSFGSRGRGVQWAALLLLSAIFVAVLEAAGLPAALLLGPMVAAIVVAAGQGTLGVPRIRSSWRRRHRLHDRAFHHAGNRRHDGSGLAPVPGADLLGHRVSALIGLLLTHWRVLPGTTAVWGSCPGAASAMTLMAEAFGADVRLVAFMQYLRVVLVTVVASLVSRIWVTPAPGHAAGTDWLRRSNGCPSPRRWRLREPARSSRPLLRIPAGPMLVPMVAGALLHGSGAMTIELPPWLLAASYAVVGWNIGLRFTRPILVHALRALPRVRLDPRPDRSLRGVAWVLTWTAGIDPLTAYLATSPGGADSVAIIAVILQRRRVLRDGAPDHALSGRPVRRPEPVPLHRAADRRFRLRPAGRSVRLERPHLPWLRGFRKSIPLRTISLSRRMVLDRQAARLRQNDNPRKSP